MHKENRKITFQNVQLKEKLSSETAQVGITLSDELHNDLKTIVSASAKQIYSTDSEDLFKTV